MYRNPDVILDYIESLIEDKEPYYIMLDEVQMLDEFEEVLNSLLHIQNADIYVTGSNSRFLSKDVITEFRGRGDEVHIHPLTFREFMEVFSGDMYHGWAEYVIYGGLPLTVTMKTEEQKIHYLTNLFQETYLKDIIERHHIEKTQELEDLINILASAVGSLTNPPKIEATFKSTIRSDISLNPKFMRFPGGCVVHGGGDGFWNTYHWKETVGPKETRRQQKNTWGYHQSMNIGYYEYFQLCEDMGMEPVPILPCGVSCQGSNGGWGLWPEQAQDVVDMKDMDRWTQDALDLIEWANGDASTKWGKVRAEAGHPEPFNLKYLGIGNEEKISPEFAERFKYMYDRITAAHPEIIIVGTDGPGSHPGNPDYEAGWKLAEELEIPINDEHYYEPREYFMKSRQYDSYPRDRKSKVYLGEYASKDKKLIDALAEALYLLHVERNGDVVVMTSYAPLLARKNATNWNPDLIYFDNERVYPTCSYYVQQMFGQSQGDYYYGDCVEVENPDKSEGDGFLQEQSVILNTKDRKLFVKVCNATDKEKTAKIDLSRFNIKKNAKMTVLKGNPEDENNFDAQPISTTTEDVKVSKKMNVKLAPWSFVMYEINL